MQRAAVVPDDNVPGLPLLAERVVGAGGVCPELVEQRFALRELEPDDVAVAPPAEEEAHAAGLRVGAHQWMPRAGSGARIGHVLVAFAHDAGAVVGGVVNRLPSLDAL